jgi:hypothetical protein
LVAVYGDNGGGVFEVGGNVYRVGVAKVDHGLSGGCRFDLASGSGDADTAASKTGQGGRFVFREKVFEFSESNFNRGSFRGGTLGGAGGLRGVRIEDGLQDGQGNRDSNEQKEED